jgi:hypothetical protein
MFKQLLGDIAPIPEEFPAHLPAQYVNDVKIPVVNVARSKAKGTRLSHVVNNQMQF